MSVASSGTGGEVAGNGALFPTGHDAVSDNQVDGCFGRINDHTMHTGTGDDLCARGQLILHVPNGAHLLVLLDDLPNWQRQEQENK